MGKSKRLDTKRLFKTLCQINLISPVRYLDELKNEYLVEIMAGFNFSELFVPSVIFDFGLLPSVFLLRKKKGTKEIRPITTCPVGQASASNFAYASA